MQTGSDVNHNNPEDNSEPSAQPVWQRLLPHWERALLVIIIMVVLAMAGSLMWPQPHAVISLKPYTGNLPQSSAVPDDPAEAASSDEGISSDEVVDEPTTSSDRDAEKDLSTAHGQHKKPGGHSHFQKKPANPPITNLNTAKLEQLQLLPGIGPKMAERILEYRKTNGGFKNVEQVMDVKGIGPKKFEKMKAFLKV